MVLVVLVVLAVAVGAAATLATGAAAGATGAGATLPTLGACLHLSADWKIWKQRCRDWKLETDWKQKQTEDT